MATSGLRKAGEGPDWYDVRLAVLAVDNYHQVVTTITVRPGLSGRGFMEVVVSATPSSEAPDIREAFISQRWAVAGQVPVEGHVSFASQVYRLVLDLDSLLGYERWVQTPLPGA